MYVSGKCTCRFRRRLTSSDSGVITYVRSNATIVYGWDVAALRKAIVDDLDGGLRPFCVVASAGTVGTGAVDPLDKIADIAHEFGLWFHVDGAYGAPATLDPEKKDLFRGLDRADSDLTRSAQWLYVPVDAGCYCFETMKPSELPLAVRMPST